MRRNLSSAWAWMTAAVLAHLVVSFIHGSAHSGAHVPLSFASSLFVYIVILAGPLIGLALTVPGLKTRPTSGVARPTSASATLTGAWLVAVTLTGSLVFGLVNHFVLESPDQVAHVDPQWRTLFATTAVLLAVTEVLGAGFAVRLVREMK